MKDHDDNIHNNDHFDDADDDHEHKTSDSATRTTELLLLLLFMCIVVLCCCSCSCHCVGACSAVGMQYAGGNRQSRIRNDAPTKVDESRRCVTHSQKAYTMDGPGGENNKLTLGSLA